MPKAYHGSCEGSLEHVGTWKSAVVGVPRRHKSDDILCERICIAPMDMKSLHIPSGASDMYRPEGP